MSHAFDLIPPRKPDAALSRSDHRKSERKVVTIPIHLMSKGLPIPLRCIASELSERGARLTVPASEWLPSSMTVVGLSNGYERHCSVAWRIGDKVGVLFV